MTIRWDTGLQLGLVLPSPAPEGVGRPGLWGRQEPGAHVSRAGVVGAPGGGRLVRAWGRLPRVEAWQLGRHVCGHRVRRLLTEGCSKAHWAHIFSSQPDWSPGHTNRASPPGGEGPTIQRSLGHRMPSEPESATLLGCGYEGQGHSGSKARPSPCCP